MFPNCHPCIIASKYKSPSWPFSPPHGRNDKHQEGNIKKNAKLQYWKDQMLIEIKGYIIHVEHKLKEHMKYDGMNENEVNPNGEHQ
jgi:hypothetical protein